MTSTQYHVLQALGHFLVVSLCEAKNMLGRCVAGGCSAFPDVEKGLVLHAIPFYNIDCPEARKRRKKWVDLVKQRRGPNGSRPEALFYALGISPKMTSFIASPLPMRRVGSPSSQDLKAHFHPRSFAVVCFCFGIAPLLNGEL